MILASGGGKSETLQFTTEDRLQPAIALLSVVALHLLNLRDASRRSDAHARPATELFPVLFSEDRSKRHGPIFLCCACEVSNGTPDHHGAAAYPGRAAELSGGLGRLLYEANPIAFIAEQAGGLATDGRGRILDIEPGSIHQRTPLFVGSREEMQSLEA